MRLVNTETDPEVVSSILLHCWRHEDRASARRILESICHNGLLLTTNAETLDTFSIDRGQGVMAMEVMQHPRVCFTDIPSDRLMAHGQRYGKYGVGFTRNTIIDWGGLPAWYVPNYWGDGTLKVAGPVLVNGLHAAMDAADHLRAFAQNFHEQGKPVTIKYKSGPALTGERLLSQMEQVKNAIFMVLSFVKEMSPHGNEDHSYIFEREWRIVSGINLAGQPPAYRALSADEKSLLCSSRPAWSKPRQSVDLNISARYPNSSPVVDSFQYFNGLPRGRSVAESIDTILVPDDSEASWASAFVAQHSHIFGETLPRVVVFPAEQG